MPLQQTWPPEQLDALEHAIVVPVQEPIGTHEGVMAANGLPAPAAPAPPPPMKAPSRLPMLKPGVQQVIPAPQRGLPAVMLHGTGGGPLSRGGVEPLASFPASLEPVFDGEDELHATTSATLAAAPIPILMYFMTRPPKPDGARRQASHSQRSAGRHSGTRYVSHHPRLWLGETK